MMPNLIKAVLLFALVFIAIFAIEDKSQKK